MRTVGSIGLWLLLATGSGCAGFSTGGTLRADFNALSEKHRNDHEKLQMEIEAQAAELRAEFKSIKEMVHELDAKIIKLQKPAAARHRPGTLDPNAVYAFAVGDSPVRGPGNAWITIIEISDYQCPYCARVQSTLKQILDAYDGEVRQVFKHNPLPFHKQALPAAIASECAHAQEYFWPIHDQIFENYRALSDDQLAQMIRQNKRIDFDTWQKCFRQRQTEPRIKNDQKAGAKLGVRGTPAFFINGRFLSGAQPLAKFKAVIDQELAKAKNSGIPRAQYYQKVVLDKGRKGL